MSKDDKLLKLPDVIELTTLKRSTIYKFINEGGFPKPINMGRGVAWLESDIKTWIKKKIDERDSVSSKEI